LTLRTTVNEVILALIRTDAGQTAKLEDNAKSDEKGKEKNWVLVESWRGTERPLPPRTRLLKGRLCELATGYFFWGFKDIYLESRASVNSFKTLKYI